MVLSWRNQIGILQCAALYNESPRGYSFYMEIDFSMQITGQSGQLFVLEERKNVAS
jgi:hypothetical protein